MKWFFILWMSFVTIFVGLIDLKMDITNLIKINSDLDIKEAATQVENGTIKVNHHFRVQQRKKINTTTIKSTIQYNRVKLFSLADKVRSDPRYKVFNYETHSNIRKHKLNKEEITS